MFLCAFQKAVHVVYPRSTQAYGDAMDFNLAEPEWIWNICLDFHVHFKQKAVHVVYPRSTQAYGDAMDFNLAKPERIWNICLDFHLAEPEWIWNICLDFHVHFKRKLSMLYIPEALRHTVMPWTSTWLNQKGYRTFS